MHLAVVDRRKFLMKNRLCYGCYDPMSKDHKRRNCPKRKTNIPQVYMDIKPKIKDGGGKRSNSTVADNYKKSVETGKKLAYASTAIHEDVISMCVVPVKVKYENSNIVHSTFAMLQSCSQGCFIKAILVNSLRMRGQTTSINVKTLTGEEIYSTVAIEGLNVCTMKSFEAEVMNQTQ